ncbi:ParA family protein [Staphylococcus epidermidis]|nr:ParA family protein [Staphylococcus epidermidis]
MTNQEEFPIVVTINQQKGGTGKSTLTKSITNYLALNKNKKVLNIDGDYSGYLTLAYYNVRDKDGTIGELFKTENIGENSSIPSVKFHKIHDNIDLVAYDSDIHNRCKYIRDEANNRYILIMWLQNEKLLKAYDYILIDTHNDFDLFTQNAIAVSDIVLAPLDPSDNVQEIVSTRMDYEFAKLKKQLIHPFTGKPFIKANMYTVGNKIMHNFGTHQEFLTQLQQRDDYLTYFPHKALFAKAAKEVKTFEEMMKENKGNHEKFYEKYQNAMETIYQAINESGEV